MKKITKIVSELEEVNKEQVTNILATEGKVLISSPGFEEFKRRLENRGDEE